MPENGLISPTQLELITTSAKKSGGQSTQSRQLLEGLLRTECNEHRHAAKNTAEARERCVDLEASVNKIANNLQQAHEVFIDATNDHYVGETSNVPKIVRID